HHWPVSKALPVRSDMPSPLKSPTWTSTQVTAVLQVAHRVVLNDEPLDRPTHQVPWLLTRPAMSIIGSRERGLTAPLKSPTTTSTQVTSGDQVSHWLLVKEEPVD